jgi:hypothetical protein
MLLASLTKQMAEGKHATDYEDAVLAILAWEFSSTERRVTETKIRRKLSVKKIGKYDQMRVDLLRRLKDQVQNEVGKGHKSKYYSKSNEEFADMKDFDTSELTKDISASFPRVPKQSIQRFIKYGIYLYYLR